MDMFNPSEFDKKKPVKKTTGSGKVGKFKAGGKGEKKPAFKGAAPPFQKKSK
jgi:hypothetical protein